MPDDDVKGTVIEYRRPIEFKPVGLADFDANGQCEVLEYRGIRFTRVGVAETDDHGGLLGAVAREEIARLSLRRGPHGESPVMQATLGGLLLLIGLMPLANIRSLSELVAAGLPWMCIVGLVGLGIIFAALRPCVYINVESSRGVFRFIFHRPVSDFEIEQFVRLVEEVFGYEIHRAMPGGGAVSVPVGACDPAPQTAASLPAREERFHCIMDQ